MTTRITKTKTQKTQPQLPDVIIEDILVRLPLKSLTRFKLVSKKWFLYITSHRFTFHIHSIFSNSSKARSSNFLVIRTLRHDHEKKFITPISLEKVSCLRVTKRKCYTIDFKGDKVQALVPIGFGILCAFDYRQGIVFLCNPTTREKKVLPPSPYYSTCGANVCHFGFMEYDDKYGEEVYNYKVGRVTSEAVTVEFHQLSNFRLSLELYSSETKAWKIIPNFYAGQYLGHGTLTSYSVNLNGRAHWVISSCQELEMYVTSFDYKTEVFTRIRAPQVVDRRYNKWNSIVTLFDDKFLCLVLFWSANVKYADIWTMREYGVEDSWIKEFTVGPICTSDQVLGFSSKARCIFLRDMHGLPTRLAICDSESLEMKWYHLPGKPQDQFIKVVELTPSLVSLK